MQSQAFGLLVFLGSALYGIAGADIKTPKVTVSGVSSGGFFAVQFHVAFSGTVSGAGVIAGGPYYCAHANVDIALTSCMKTPSLISVDELVTITHTTYATTRTIDNPDNLAHGSRVWLFTGTKDTIVDSGVVHKLEAYYGGLGVTDIKLVDTIPAEHSWVTESYGNACAYKGEPFINSCGFDAAGELLAHLYGGSAAADATAGGVITGAGKLVTIDQSKYVPGLVPPKTVGLGKEAYAYVPEGCALRGGEDMAGSQCGVHVAFHGCEQYTDVIGLDFVNNTGLNAHASTYNIIVLYPQAVTTLTNPKGCWDWFGYSGVDYASKIGVQMATVKAMVDAIA